jgi:DNA segregation ATPase FtsK/SpoIIIE-like protein
VDRHHQKEAHNDYSDDLYKWAVTLVRRERKVSTSFLQIQLQLGFKEASRLMERMEKERVVSNCRFLDS